MSKLSEHDPSFLAGRVAVAAIEQAQRVIERTRKTKIRLSRHERYKILNTLAGRLEEERDKISYLITSESGLCQRDTTYEVNRAMDVLRFAAWKMILKSSPVILQSTAGSGVSTQLVFHSISLPRLPRLTIRSTR